MSVEHIKLGRNKDFTAALDEAALHRLRHRCADGRLRAVHGGGVDVAVSGGDAVDDDGGELERKWARIRLIWIN